MVEKIVKWICFSGIVSLLPLVLTGVILANHEHLDSLSLTWERGEFVLIAATLLIAALGDLITSENKHMRKTKMATGLIVMFCAIILCCWYGSIVESLIAGEKYAKAAVITYSPFFYIFSLFSSLGCLILSAPTQEDLS